VSETNRYAAQCGSSFVTYEHQVERYIGILIKMGIVQLPRYRLYWSTELRYGGVADYMSRDDFDTMSRFIHFDDNAQLITNRKDDKYDALYKVRPLLDILRSQCLKVEPLQKQSIDEQIIPFKGKHGLKQYLPKKPKKWGFKVIFRCCAETGFVHDFVLYNGKGPDLAEAESCGYQPGDFVVLLCKSLPLHLTYLVYFDNWFNFPELHLKLRQMGIHSIGTLRSNRMRGCQLTSEAELRKKGRGAMDSKVDVKHGICITRWFDNRAVQISSTCTGVEPVSMVKRWDKKENKVIDIPCPAAVTEYNSHMGGVDLFDMLSALYRIDHKSTKWYRRVFFWCLNVAVINGWLLHKRHSCQLAVPRKEIMDLLDFTVEVAHSLILENKEVELPARRKRGRPSAATADETDEEHLEVEPLSVRKKRFVQPSPNDGIRYDAHGHWPLHSDDKGRCRYCKKGICRTVCSKCSVHLCLTAERNCYMHYHVPGQ
jgi:hypothetical protein